ncbi:DUF4430 domain-containing protein [Microbacteriaceae bacterium 4G12]
MKKRFTLLFVLICSLFLALALGGCSASKEKSSKAASPKEESQITVQIVTDGGKTVVADKKINIKDENLLTIMKENFKIVENKGFVTSIENINQDDAAKKYWLFEINDKPVPKGAQDVVPKKGDKVVWKLEKMS